MSVLSAAVSLEESVERVRLGLEARARRVAGRVGGIGLLSAGRKMLRTRFCLLLGAGLGVDRAKAEAASRAMELVHNLPSARRLRGPSGPAPGEPPPTPSSASTWPFAGRLGVFPGLEEAIEISPNAGTHLVTAVRDDDRGTAGGVLGRLTSRSRRIWAWFPQDRSPFSSGAATCSPNFRRSSSGRRSSPAGLRRGHPAPACRRHPGLHLEGRILRQGPRPGSGHRRLTLPCLLSLQGSEKGRFLELWETKDSKALGEFLQKGGYIEAAREKGGNWSVPC